MAAIADFVMLIDGISINGEVLVKVFTVKTKYGNLKVKRDDILTITYKNPPVSPTDEIQLSAGTKLTGVVLPEVIPVRIEDTDQVLKISKKDIHTIVLFTSDKRVLGKKTTKMIAMLRDKAG